MPGASDLRPRPPEGGTPTGIVLSPRWSPAFSRNPSRARADHRPDAAPFAPSPRAAIRAGGVQREVSFFSGDRSDGASGPDLEACGLDRGPRRRADDLPGGGGGPATEPAHGLVVGDAADGL